MLNLYSVFYLITSLAIVFLIIFKIKTVSNFLNLKDKPKNTTEQTNNKTPLLGGLLILIILSNYYAIYYQDDIFFKLKYIFLLIIYFFIGLIDDYIDLNAINKLIICSFFTYIFLIFNEEIIINKFYSSILEKEFDLGKINIIFKIICFLILFNILNLLDGINGSLLSFSISVILVFLQITLEPFILIFAAATLIVLSLNLKNKLFLGNSGASLMSAVFAILLIILYNNYEQSMYSEKILILFFLPLIDAIRLFIQRIFNNRSPFQRDLNHFHHLVLSNFSKKTWVITLILANVFFYNLSHYINDLYVLLIQIFLYYTLIKINFSKLAS